MTALPSALSRRNLLRTAAVLGTGAGLLAADDLSALGAQRSFRTLENTPYLRSTSDVFLRRDPALFSPDYVGGLRYMHGEAFPRYLLKGRWVIHPTVLGNFINGHIATFENAGTRTNLTTAANVLTGLMNVGTTIATTEGQATFMPYDFPWETHGVDMFVPWYSAFGQSKFPRAAESLYRHTGDRRFLDYEKRLFNAFLVPPAANRPWVAGVDANNCLWLDEYPHQTTLSSVFNGHMYALLELLKYAETSGSSTVRQFVRGALFTAHNYRDRCRVPGRFSNYFLNYPDHVASYHMIHAQCYSYMFGVTGNAPFGVTVDQMLRDWPTDNRAGTVKVLANINHWLYRGGTYQRWTPTTTQTFTSSTRIGLNQRGPWSLLSSGPKAGWYIKEGPWSFRQGLDVERWRWRTPRKVWFESGANPVVGYRILADGTRQARTSMRSTSRSSASSNQRAFLAGRHHLYITNGRYANTWVEESTQVHH